MKGKALILALTLLGVFVFAFFAGAQPGDISLLKNVASVNAASDGFQLANEVQGRAPQTDVDPLDAAKAYVEEAIGRYRADPEAAIKHYSSQESIDDEFGLQLLLLRNGRIVVNPAFPSSQGSSITQVTDPLGQEYGKALSEADESGLIVEHLATDPSDNFTFRVKTNWAKRAEGHVFSAGWIDTDTDVEPTLTKRQKAIGTVIKARDRLLANGYEHTVTHYNSRASIDENEFYIIVAAPPDGNIVADATGHLRLGTKLRDIEASDDPELGQKILALGEGERLWITHQWPHPETGLEKRRHTYATKFANFYFIAGYYEDTPLDATIAYVNEAIKQFRDDPAAAKEYYGSRESITEDGLYLLLLRDGSIDVNPTFPHAVGTDITWRTDPLEREYGRALAEADEDGEIVEYLIPIPSQNFTFRKKTAWAIRADGLVFSAGWVDMETDVESTLTKRQKAIGTVIEVRARMQSRGLRPAIVYYNTPESIDEEYYAILAQREGYIVADATRADLLLDANIRDMEASDDPEVGQKIAAVGSGESAWITHLWPNPVTGQEERRHTYVTRFLSFYIISGYYEPEPCVQPVDGSRLHTGNWDDSCVSETRPQDVDGGGKAGETYYARFYTFTLDEESDVTITLKSDADAYLYLLDGHGKGGSVEAENDDVDADNRDSRIEARLDAGEYTIEATTYEAGTAGSFNMQVDVDAPPPPTEKYKAISSGAKHACAITVNGSIDCRGDNSFGQVSKRPTSGSFTAISSGDDHTCALRDDGEWICWGGITVP